MSRNKVLPAPLKTLYVSIPTDNRTLLFSPVITMSDFCDHNFLVVLGKHHILVLPVLEIYKIKLHCSFNTSHTVMFMRFFLFSSFSLFHNTLLYNRLQLIYPFYCWWILPAWAAKNIVDMYSVIPRDRIVG